MWVGRAMGNETIYWDGLCNTESKKIWSVPQFVFYNHLYKEQLL